MTEPTTSELMRIVQQMAEDSKEHRRELKETIGVLASDIRELKENTGEIKIQTIKTNGNVVQLRTDVYGGDGKDGLVKSYDGLKGRERYVAGALAVCFALFGLVPFFLNLYIEKSVAEAVKMVYKDVPVEERQLSN